jgi:hypothetical protein
LAIHSGQKFAFEISLMFKLMEDIRTGITSRSELAKYNGLGENKIESCVDYLNKLDVIEIKLPGRNFSCTYFGTTILKLKSNPEFVEPLFLYKLVRLEKQGGHLYFSILINDLLYDVAFRIDNHITQQAIVETFLSKYENITVGNRVELLKQAFKTGLANSVSGFGKMGMVVEKDGTFEIVGYIPHKLVTAFILYDNWPRGRAALKLNELVTADYLPGRIFFMSQDVLYQQLHELAAERLIYIEQQAGLDQIRLNPEIGPQDILDRMVEYAEQTNALTATGL